MLFRRTNGVIDIARETILTEEVRERLKIYSAAVFDRSSDDPFLIKVRRGSALKDALGLVRISQEDLASPLRIRFIGE
ncbi:hypothetical protein DPMN_007064 [Dreissena polymorpha]|uniref:Uncharacterized protein n=1 Tax=Dreissena polymorpha TaxID=45954 RepID=A0A9D4MWL6_DREPO|nr:hypothetical protein DPMN_007064 [Dreissena polymorpha]